MMAENGKPDLLEAFRFIMRFLKKAAKMFNYF